MSSMKRRSINKTHETTAYKKRHADRMWRHMKRHGWWIGLLLLLVGEVVFQVLYPSDRTLPLARYNHEPYGWKTRDELLVKEQTTFVNTQVELRARFGTEKVALLKTGAQLNETANFTALRAYSQQWRWVPFSILFYQPNVTTLTVTYADEPLKEFAQAYAKKHEKAPEDAAISIQEDGAVAVKDGKRGRSIGVEALQNALRDARVDTSGVARVDVPERAILPSSTAADMAAVRQQAEEVIAKKITISVAGRDNSFMPNRAQLASWLTVTTEGGEPQLAVASEKLAAYIAELNGQVARPAGQTVVHIVDGQEASRQDGSAGEQINRGDFEQKMSSLLLEPGQYKYVTAVLEPIAPQVKATYAYSHSQAGLQVKMNDIGHRYDVRISLEQLDGAGWQASYRGNESTPSASTYKLYVAIRLFHDMAEGRTTWQSPILDTTVAGCFEQMIAVSTNQCAEEWLRQFGRESLNNFLYQRGISSATSFTTGSAVQTSADDLVRVVKGVQRGSLAAGGERETLLGTMSRQIWRKGIPAGTQGWTSNKVGFLWDYVHDVGVVHHPRGTYVMAVMTKGASYDIIAQITRELEAQMYP